ncbi:CsbD family protein [Micromonospora phytophila]|uniref:CsbD family protein n=1 Tax=Micromonospora phytophila TaxID=709888 RepID=UPI0020302169|nr:CsbD family protein [Micromonospora phytophila]MCM0676092.1 CsbD family protein [Micromonospora phytophila]
MSFIDKAKNKGAQLTGAAKQRIGGMTHNERLRNEGTTQQSDAQARAAGEHLKDAGQDVKDAFSK